MRGSTNDEGRSRRHLVGPLHLWFGSSIPFNPTHGAIEIRTAYYLLRLLASSPGACVRACYTVPSFDTDCLRNKQLWRRSL